MNLLMLQLTFHLISLLKNKLTNPISNPLEPPLTTKYMKLLTNQLMLNFKTNY